MRGAFALAGFVLLAIVWPAPADAQPDAFLELVRTTVAAASASSGPDRADALRTAAGRLRAALDDWDRRLETMRATVEREAPAAALSSDAARLQTELGRAYALRGRTRDALRAFDAAAGRVPMSSDVELWRALTLEAAGPRFDAAPAFVAAWSLDAGSLVKAYYAAQRAVGAAPADRARARAVLSQAYATLDVDAAPSALPPFPILETIPDTLSPAPIIGDDLTSEAFALLRSGRFDDAVIALQRAAVAPAAAGVSPREHFARGQRHEAENHMADARREYEAALDGVLSGRSAIWVGLGRLAQVDGDGPAAITAFEQAARLTPNDPLVHRELADAYASQDRRDDALAELMAALLIAPRDAHAHAAVGSLLLDGDRPADAVMALTRALALMPARYQTRYTLARAFDRLGRADDAARERALFEKARLESLGQRRRIMATDLDAADAIRREQSGRGGAK